MNRVALGFGLGLAAASLLGQTTTTIPVPVPSAGAAPPPPPAAPAQPVELEMRLGRNVYPVRINQPFTVTTPKGEKVDVVIRRRDVLQFSGGGIRFSYPRQMQVTTQSSGGVLTISAESVGSTLALIQVFNVPTSPASVRKQLADTFKKEFRERGAKSVTSRPAQRRMLGAVRSGELLEWAVAGQRLRSEIYAFQKDGATVAVVFQRPAEDEKQAARYFTIISDSLR